MMIPHQLNATGEDTPSLCYSMSEQCDTHDCDLHGTQKEVELTSAVYRSQRTWIAEQLFTGLVHNEGPPKSSKTKQVFYSLHPSYCNEYNVLEE
eukprot:5541870-Amphidinium_carterae.1